MEEFKLRAWFDRRSDGLHIPLEAEDDSEEWRVQLCCAQTSCVMVLLYSG